MNQHDQEHEAWIEAFTLNERERIPERALSDMERCRTCVERRAEIAAARSTLSAYGEQMRADLRAAEAMAPQPDELERVRRWAGLERAASESARAQRADAPPTRSARVRAKPRPLAWVAALAALLAVFAAGYFLSRRDSTSRGGEHLGSSRISALNAAVDALRVTCTWRAEALGDETHQAQVRFRDAQGRSHEFASDMLFESRWEFEASRVAQAAGSFEWRVLLCSPARSTPEASDWVLQPLPAR